MGLRMDLKQRLLKETKEYYEEDPIGRRGLDDKGKCEYSTISGKKCALGRTMTEETLQNIPADGGSYSVIIEDIPESIELLESYEGLKFVVPFLDDFHDDSVNWDLLGLTTTGKTTYKALMEKYA